MEVAQGHVSGWWIRFSFHYMVLQAFWVMTQVTIVLFLYSGDHSSPLSLYVPIYEFC
jgi:hypothetical protein